jgi:hypothetical protein
VGDVPVKNVVTVRLDEGGFGDRELVWAMVIREGLLYRSWAVHTVQKAESLLASFSVDQESSQ